MPFDIVTDAPRGPRIRRFFRALRGLAGVLLTAAGLLAAVPLAMLAVLLVVLGGDADPGSLDADELGPMALLALTAAACLWAGRRLIRGHRRLALFLRRFGFEGSSRTLTFAVSTALGRRWRLVTLDDQAISPVGVAAGARRGWGLGRWIMLAVALAAIAYAASWLHGDAPGDLLGGIFDDIQQGSRDRGDNPFEALFAAIIGTIAVGAVVLMVAMIAVVIPAAVLGTLTVFSWGTWRSIRKAERAKALHVDTADDITPAVARIVQRTRRIFAPRLVVLRAAHAIWQEVVRALADAADVVLIDVSEPTENVLWEIETLRRHGGAPWILVGRRDRVEALAGGGARAGDERALAARVVALIDSEEVLVYEGEEPAALARFAKALRGRLEGTVS